MNKFVGVYSEEVTPDPIPNSEVKLLSGNGTARVTVCESSTMPASNTKALVEIQGLFIFEFPGKQGNKASKGTRARDQVNGNRDQATRCLDLDALSAMFASTALSSPF